MYRALGLDNNDYDGTGINIGVLSEGIPDNDDLMAMISDNYDEDGIPTDINRNSLATGIISLMIGYYDILGVQGANYIFSLWNDNNQPTGDNNQPTGYKTAFDALINENADIILSTAPIELIGSGVYNNYCAYIDYIIQSEDCLVIQAAGNNDTSANVLSPGVSVNGITVGASTKNRTVADFSNSGLAENLETIVYKPDLLAPGESICGLILYFGGDIVPNNTCLSAALVTCAAVKLMDEFSVLKYNAHLLKTVLLAGCDKVSNHQGFLDPNAGAGIVDYKDSRDLMSNCEYKTFTKQANGTVNSEFAIVLGAGEIATFYYTSMFPGSNDSWNETQHALAPTSYSIYLYDPQQTVIIDSAGISRPSGTFTLENDTNAPMVLSFKIETIFNVHSSRTEYLAFLMDCPTHTHSYTQAAHATSTTSHMLYCSCGAKKTGAHVYVTGATHLCETCGYDDSTQMYDTHVHNFVTYSNYNSTTHKLSCTCGEYVTGAHVKDSNGNCILCPDA